MSMVGLFTTASQPVGATTATDDAAAAEGFGSALQGALAALAGAGGESTPEDGAALDTEALTDLNETGGLPASATSLAALIETPLGGSVPASTGSATGTSPALPELTLPVRAGAAAAAGRAVGSETSGRVPASTNSATETSLVEPVETPAGGMAPASTSSATATTLPSLAPLGSTLPVPDGAPASAGRAVGSETPAGSPVPASTSSATVTAVPSSAPHAETPASNVIPASASAATGPAVTASQTPPLKTDGTPSANQQTVPPSGANQQTVPPSGAGPAGTVAGNAVPVSLPVARTSTAATDPAPVPATSVIGAPAAAAVVQTAAVAPAAAPSPTASVPFAAQLAKPIFSLAAAGAGEHVMTVSVTPDNLGPVTVRAHVGVEGVRVELFAPNDLGREAIRAVLTDLRRDLAGAGLGGNLTLSSQNHAPSHSGAGQSGAGGAGPEGGAAERGAARDGQDRANPPAALADPEPRRAQLFGTASTIDVMA